MPYSGQPARALIIIWPGNKLLASMLVLFDGLGNAHGKCNDDDIA